MSTAWSTLDIPCFSLTLAYDLKVWRPAQRLEIFTGAGRRRAWTAEQKAAIVA